VLEGEEVVGYEVEAFAVGVTVGVVTKLPGETDEVEETVVVVVEDVVTLTVELVVAVLFALAAEVMHEQTAPALFLAASAVAKPQALVAHPRALITIEFDIAGWHWEVVSRNQQMSFPKRGKGEGVAEEKALRVAGKSIKTYLTGVVSISTTKDRSRWTNTARLSQGQHTWRENGDRTKLTAQAGTRVASAVQLSWAAANAAKLRIDSAVISFMIQELMDADDCRGKSVYGGGLTRKAGTVTLYSQQWTGMPSLV
jgi:hypothetical protein